MVRELEGGHTHTAGRGMDEQRLAPAHVREIPQAVERGEEHDRKDGGVRERPALRHPGQPPVVGDRDRPDRTQREQSRHPVTDRHRGHPGTGLHDDTGRLSADARLVPRIHAEADQHVAEVQPGGTYGDPHFALVQRCAGLGRGEQREIAQGARAVHVQPPVRGVLRRDKHLGRRVRPHQAGGVVAAVADGELVFAPGEQLRQGRRQSLRAVLGGGVQVQQAEAVRMLGPGGPQQTPDSGCGQVPDLGARAGGHGTSGHHDQPGLGRGVAVRPVQLQPALRQLQRQGGQCVQPCRQAVGRGHTVVLGLEGTGRVRRVVGEGGKDECGRTGTFRDGGEQCGGVGVGHRAERVREPQRVRADDHDAFGDGRGAGGGQRFPVEQVERASAAGVRAAGRDVRQGAGTRGEGLHRGDRGARRVGGAQPHRVRAGTAQPHPEPGRLHGVQRDPLPAEGQQDVLRLAHHLPRPRVEGGVEEGGVQGVPGGVDAVGQGDLGVEVVAVAPEGGESLEGGTVGVAACVEVFVQAGEVDGFAERRPGDRLGRRVRVRQGAGGMPGPGG